MPRMSDIVLANIPDDKLLYSAPDGSQWGPIACGEHQPERPEGVSPPPPQQQGFKRNCAACRLTAQNMIEHFNTVQRVSPA